MPDETNEPPEGPPADAPIAPQFYQFPEELLKRWVSIPESTQVGISLTRRDIDHLLFALLRSNDAQNAIDLTLVRWSNGDLAGANLALNEFRRLSVDSQNMVRYFFTAVMESALKGLPDG